ncbi:MAG: PKD domain-containing protein [Candidatus Omnitrophica bacterium]|nr:PKD domain-containing protein [Candidatus Omnitrophota bacterium]
MRRAGLLLVLLLLLSGCATYKFQKGPAPYDKGYVVSYDGKLIPEYTLGQNDSVPDLALAKERFKRRRAKVEYYYKRMGQIEARFKELFWDPPAMMVDFLGGLLRWPFVAVSDYKYNHNPKYKEKVDRLDEQAEESEKAKIDILKIKLKAYIDKDLVGEAINKELLVSEAVVSAQQAPVVKAPVAAVPPVAAVEKPVPVVPTKKDKKVLAAAEPATPIPPVAVIIAKPSKGPSPLQVSFNAGKSYSKSGKIVSYIWDFGDGDTSTKKNPLNTYWSATYGSRLFTATLTIKDEKGQTASTSTIIEVVTK